MLPVCCVLAGVDERPTPDERFSDLVPRADSVDWAQSLAGSPTNSVVLRRGLMGVCCGSMIVIEVMKRRRRWGEVLYRARARKSYVMRATPQLPNVMLNLDRDKLRPSSHARRAAQARQLGAPTSSAF